MSKDILTTAFTCRTLFASIYRKVISDERVTDYTKANIDILIGLLEKIRDGDDDEIDDAR